MAVVVNGLVNSLTVIKAASRLLETYWEQLPERDRASMLADITRHAGDEVGVAGSRRSTCSTPARLSPSSVVRRWITRRRSRSASE